MHERGVNSTTSIRLAQAAGTPSSAHTAITVPEDNQAAQQMTADDRRSRMRLAAAAATGGPAAIGQGPERNGPAASGRHWPGSESAGGGSANGTGSPALLLTSSSVEDDSEDGAGERLMARLHGCDDIGCNSRPPASAPPPHHHGDRLRLQQPSKNHVGYVMRIIC